MSEKTKRSIYYFKNHIQIQKLNCVLKMCFSTDKLTLRTDIPCNLNKMRHQNLLLGQNIHCVYTDEVRELMFKKYFKIR